MRAACMPPEQADSPNTQDPQTGGLWSSADAGDSWRAVSQSLPPIYAVRFG
ncbi:MAG: hypothetical protein ACRC2B_00875 [Rubrivivax sp.]